VAIEAASGNIGDVLLGVLALHFGLVVAFIAVNIGVRSIMAARTIPTGISVTHGETMAADINIAPTVRVMALRTLP